MPRKSIAIVVAMRLELAPLLRDVRAQRADGIELFVPNAIVAMGGMGVTAARKAAEVVMHRYEPATLISAGIAGAMTAKLKVGDVLQGSRSWTPSWRSLQGVGGELGS